MELLKIKNNKIFINKKEIKINNIKVDNILVDNKNCRLKLLADNNLEISRNIESGTPIFYGFRNSDQIILCSDINSFPNNLIREENKQAVPELLSRGYVLPPQTLYKNIFRIPLFHTLIISLLKGGLKTKLLKKIIIRSKKKSKSNIKNLLAKEIQMPNKKCSILFSGGLDSTILAKLSKNKNPSLFSTGFEFLEEDLLEKDYALSAANVINAKTKYDSFDFKHLLLNLPEVIYLSGEPLNHLQTLLLYATIKKNKGKMSNILLNGQGADGVFGTGSQYKYLHDGEELSLLNPIINKYSFLKKDYLVNSQKNTKEFLKKIDRLCNLDKDFIVDILGDVDITMNSWSACAKKNAKQMRYPFFNEKVIAEIVNIPWEKRLYEPKYYIREMARGLNIPEDIITRKKGSFGPISSLWGRYLIPLVQLGEGFFNSSEINKFVKLEENRYVLWNIVNYIIWRKIYIEGKSIEDIRRKLKRIINNENKKY